MQSSWSFTTNGCTITQYHHFWRGLLLAVVGLACHLHAQKRADYFANYQPRWAVVPTIDAKDTLDLKNKAYSDLYYVKSVITDKHLYILCLYNPIKKFYDRIEGFWVAKYDINTGDELWYNLFHFKDHPDKYRRYTIPTDIFIDSDSLLQVIGHQEVPNKEDKGGFPYCQFFRVTYNPQNGQIIDSLFLNPEDSTTYFLCHSRDDLFRTCKRLYDHTYVNYAVNNFIIGTNITYYFFINLTKINHLGQILHDTFFYFKENPFDTFTTLYLPFAIRDKDADIFSMILKENLKADSNIRSKENSQWLLLHIDSNFHILDTIDLYKTFEPHPIFFRLQSSFAFEYYDNDYFITWVNNGSFGGTKDLYFIFDYQGNLRHQLMPWDQEIYTIAFMQIEPDKYFLIGDNPVRNESRRFNIINFGIVDIGKSFYYTRKLKLKKPHRALWFNALHKLPDGDFIGIGYYEFYDSTDNSENPSTDPFEITIIRFSGADFGLTNTQQPDHTPSANAIQYHLAIHHKERALSIHFDKPFSGYLTISSAQGRVLHTTHLHQSRSHSLDLQSLPPGIYFLSGQSRDGRSFPTKSFALW